MIEFWFGFVLGGIGTFITTELIRDIYFLWKKNKDVN